MRKMYLRSSCHRAMLVSFVGLSTSCLVACSAVEMGKAAPEPLKDVGYSEQKVTLPKESIKLTADQVYRVLAAESLNLRGESASAAQVYIDLTNRYARPEFAQRAYDLSLASGSGRLLSETAKLNTELNPNRIESWQASVVMALREGQVEQAVQSWNAYFKQGLARGASAKSLYMSTVSLVQDDLPSEIAISFSARIAQEQPSEYAEFVHVMFLASANQTNAAFERLLLAIERYPDRAELMQLLASLAVRSADNRAVVPLQVYLDRHPEDIALAEQLGRLYVGLQRLVEARAQFERILASHVNLPNVAMSLALIELELGDAAAAQVRLESLVADARLADMARYYLGQAYYLQQLTDAAVEQWKQVTQGSYRLDALIWRAQILGKQKRYDQAEKLISGFEPAGDEEYVRWVRAYIKLMTLQNKFAPALKLLDKAVFSYPQVSEFWQERANIKYELADKAGFEHDIREAMKLAPDDADVLNALGFYLADAGHSLVESRTLLEKANELAPNRHYIVDSLGWLAFKEGRLDQSLQLLEKAYQLKPDSEILRHRLMVLLAMKQELKAKQLAKQEAKRFAGDDVLMKFLKQMSLMP